MKPVHVVGAGLAGSEAAWALAHAGVPVVLHEMRPLVKTAAHQTNKFAELVCSNSFRSDDWRGNAVGLLHEEMRRCGSLVMACAGPAQVPAGSALAVDRDVFSDAVSAALEAHELIQVRRGEVTSLEQMLKLSENSAVIPDARSAIWNPGATGAVLDVPLGSGFSASAEPGMTSFVPIEKASSSAPGRSHPPPSQIPFARSPARIHSPSSTPSHPSSMPIRSISTSPGCSRVMTRKAQAGTRPPT